MALDTRSVGRMKKKKDYRFFWEQPAEQKKELKDVFAESELKFSFPGMEFPEIKMEKTMRVNVAETGSDIVVRVEVPGYKKDEVSVNVTENSIEISAYKKSEKIERTERLFTQQKSAGAVKQAFTLPAKVSPENAEARMKDGVLTITLPKHPSEQKKRRRLDIK